MLHPSTLTKNYKHRLSDFNTWDQKEHAKDWILLEDNIGEYLSIDETAPSRGDLMTILSNKAGHGQKGTIVATVSGTKSEELSVVFNRMPLEKRLAVKEVTMDFSDSMREAVEESFPQADITIDCFHIIQLATNALSDVRMKHKRKAMAEDAKARKEFDDRKKRNAEQNRRRDEKRKAEGRKKSKSGRKRNRKNEAYEPPRFENGDTPTELLTRGRYFLGKSRNEWTPRQKERSETLFREYPDLLTAYNLVNDLRTIFKNKKHTPQTAKTAIDQWQTKVKESRIKNLQVVASTIMSRIDHVTNYFKERHTNASAESLNSKIKGFRALQRGVSDMEFFLYRLVTIFG